MLRLPTDGPGERVHQESERGHERRGGSVQRGGAHRAAGLSLVRQIQAQKTAILQQGSHSKIRLNIYTLFHNDDIYRQ